MSKYGSECADGIGNTQRWTDEEKYKNVYDSVPVRYALGLHRLDEGHFDLRTTHATVDPTICYFGVKTSFFSSNTSFGIISGIMSASLTFAFPSTNCKPDILIYKSRDPVKNWKTRQTG